MFTWRRLLGAAAAIAVVGLGIAAVLWFTQPPLNDATAFDPNIEVEWTNAISRLGIDPVYPPEEDLVVGDLLAIVVSDDPDPSEVARENRLDKKSPILRRSVKIAHVDLRKQLSDLYSTLPKFPKTAAPIAAPGSPDDGIFMHDMLQGELPQAAFPSLVVHGTNSASFGGSILDRGKAQFGSSQQGLEELHLSDVRTYGLPAARALDALSKYCSAPPGQPDCLDSTARRHLRPIVGPRIDNQYVDAEGQNRYGVQIELGMVTRVYMANSIVHVRRSGSQRSGGFGAGQMGQMALPAPPKGEQDATQAQTARLIRKGSTHCAIK
jgi:hypothetical protein